MDSFIVTATWDSEAEVWVAESDDIPGLATEADTVDALAAKLKVMVPELFEINWPESNDPIPYELRAYRFEVARPAS